MGLLLMASRSVRGDFTWRGELGVSSPGVDAMVVAAACMVRTRRMVILWRYARAGNLLPRAI
jgi:hypothetical protein